MAINRRRKRHHTSLAQRIECLKGWLAERYQPKKRTMINNKFSNNN